MASDPPELINQRIDEVVGKIVDTARELQWDGDLRRHSPDDVEVCRGAGR